MTYTVPQLLSMSQSQLDALFSSVEAGPVPDGECKGTAIVAPGTVFTPDIAALINTFAWQGKVFDRESMTLRNQILPFGLRAIIADIRRDDSWLDGKECIVLDYSKTSEVAHWIRDEIRLIQPSLYLGKVYWSHTKNSSILPWNSLLHHKG